ncbi:MAG: glycosyltransferase family 2 protein [Coriobacteriia bacterium]|nr:glycosyltransferase family 2 protein [Coriobacteriia bacterium]MCL2536879.1 glycosyltransferase family 2 protein [Coriobacteriia bacterium]
MTKEVQSLTDPAIFASVLRDLREQGLKIAVLLPCYNEAQTISDTVSAYIEILKDVPGARVYVYDNNSADNTAELAARAGAVVCHEYRQGKGFVIRSMFRDIDADIYLMADGDNTYDAHDVTALARDIIDGRANMVVGDRLSSTYFQENKRPLHGLGNRLVRWLINRIFKSDILDVMTGARAFSRQFVKTYPSLVGGFEIETEMTIHALDKDSLVTHKPVLYRDRPHGSTSKLNTIPDGLRVLKTIFALFKDFRPLLFFGSISLILFLMGAVLFLRPLIEYLETGQVTYMPTLLTSITLLIMSLLSGVCGVVVDSIRKQTRTFYELELYRHRSINSISAKAHRSQSADCHANGCAQREK